MALAGDRSPLNMGLVTPHFNRTPAVLAGFGRAAFCYH